MTGRSREGREINYLVYSAPLHDQQGKVQYALEMSLDLTERKNLEKKLQINQIILQSIIDHSLCGIMALDQQGQGQIFNPLAARISGYDSSEISTIQEAAHLLPKKIAEIITSLLEDKKIKNPHFLFWPEIWLRLKKAKRFPSVFRSCL